MQFAYISPQWWSAKLALAFPPVRLSYFGSSCCRQGFRFPTVCRWPVPQSPNIPKATANWRQSAKFNLRFWSIVSNFAINQRDSWQSHSSTIGQALESYRRKVAKKLEAARQKKPVAKVTGKEKTLLVVIVPLFESSIFNLKHAPKVFLPTLVLIAASPTFSVS